MKQLLYLILCLLIVSCSVSQEPELLSQAESNLDKAPDSVFTMLRNSGKEAANYEKRYRMKYLLIYAEAMNKAYLPMDTIQYMDDVLSYYKHHKGNDLTQAYYMMGCVYRDKGNSSEALHYYTEAVNHADTTSKDCDFLQLSRIYGQIALVFTDRRLPSKELDAWKKCRQYALIAKDTIAAIQAYERSGNAYILWGKEDSAFQCFNKAYHEYKKYGYNEYAACSQITRAWYFLRKGKTDEAGYALDVYRKESGLFDSKGIIKKGFEFYYKYVGQYYEQKKDYSTAIRYYQRLSSYPDNIQNLENAYKGLMSVYGQLELSDSVIKYAKLYAATNDSANVLKSATELIHTQSLYDYSESQEQAAEKIKESRNLWRLLFTSFVVIAIILILFSFFYRRHKVLTKKAKEEYQNALSQLNNAEHELECLQQDSEQFKQQKQEEISKLKSIVSVYKENFKPEEWNKEQSLLNLDVVLHLHKLANQGTAMSGREWSDLEDTLKKLRPELINRIRSLNSTLTFQEYEVCILTRLKFSPTDISNLLGISQQRVTNIRGQINLKLFQQRGTKNLSTNISRI